jgi:hypothetical protein
MGKEQAMRDTCYRVLGNVHIHLFTGQLYGLIHVINTQVLTHETQKMFGAACNDYLTTFFINEPNGIAN